MPLQQLHFTFPGGEGAEMPGLLSHTGVVGSGDMEILIESRQQEGAVSVTVTTPVHGFDDVWEKVLARFVEESGLRDVSLEINDNNATPYIVAMRLRQALQEAKEGGGNG